MSAKDHHSTPLRLAVLGAGRIGQVHAKAIAGLAHARLVAVADTIEAAADKIAHQYDCDARTIDDIVSSSDVDAVVICTPTNTHADLITAFAHAGKAIFCEKPIALDLQRAKQCLATVEETSAKLMLGFNRRFDPHFAALQQAIAHNHVGDVEQILITSRDPAPPPPGYLAESGGIFRDMTIHDFDIARFLIGEEFVSVQVMSSVLVDKTFAEHNDYDTATVLLQTHTGKQCTIINSRRAAYGYDQRIEVLGASGMISAENQRPVCVETANASGFHRPALHTFFMTRYEAAYSAEIAAFVEAIRGQKQPSPSGRDGLIALQLADAATQAALTGNKISVQTDG